MQLTLVPDTGNAWRHLDAEFMQTYPTSQKQLATLVRRTDKYLWQRHTFSLLSYVRIYVRGELLLPKRNEKTNIQFNYMEIHFHKAYD